MSMATSKPNASEKQEILYARGKHVQFKDAPTNDQLLDMVLALSSELSVLRDRIDTHERLAAEQTAATLEAVEAYEPDQAIGAERSKQRQRILSKVFWTLRVSFARKMDALKKD